tara:strand:+ start:1699 stop:3054 length:1356 start_codon:yes stop_codon:yes gene_type:complete
MENNIKTIYCNIHKYTQWESLLISIIDTPEFQRLRQIKQLGTCHYIFPGACHTRFEHSLGVAYLAEQFMICLQKNQPELNIKKEDILLFKIAGLCHDLGHGPVSHGFDEFIDKLNKTVHYEIKWKVHEERSIEVLKVIVDKYNIPITKKQIQVIAEIIYPQTMELPKFWYQILANVFDGIDVDKFDYIKRDCLMTGIECDTIDICRFMEYARVYEETICYPVKLTFDINHLFLTRHRLHSQIYQHPIVRSLEWMHIDYLNCIASSLDTYLQSIEGFCELTDIVFTKVFLNSLKLPLCKKNKANELLNRIYSREVYKFIVEMKVPFSELESDSTSSIDTIKKVYHDVGINLFGKDNWENDWILDFVKIGYTLNPLYKVKFYGLELNSNVKCHYYKTGTNKVNCLPINQSSITFPKESLDYIARIYCKSKKPENEKIDAIIQGFQNITVESLV